MEEFTELVCAWSHVEIAIQFDSLMHIMLPNMCR